MQLVGAEPHDRICCVDPETGAGISLRPGRPGQPRYTPLLCPGLPAWTSMLRMLLRPYLGLPQSIQTVPNPSNTWQHVFHRKCNHNSFRVATKMAQ